MIVNEFEHQRFLQEIIAAGVKLLNEQAFEILRLEAGLPAVNYELIEDFTPLETNLRSAISSDKGCYTGQEVIARQITYGKVSQSLCAIKLGQPVPHGTQVLVEGKSVGRVTSSGISPRFGALGLAVIRHPYFQPGTVLIINNRTAEVIELPL